MVVDGTVERIQNIKKKTPLCTPTVKFKSKLSSSSSQKENNGKSRRNSQLITIDMSEVNLESPNVGLIL